MKSIRKSPVKSRYRSKCKKYLSKKIGINMREFNNGLYKSKAQAIAVAYSQVRKSHPNCKRIIKSRKIRKSRVKRTPVKTKCKEYLSKEIETNMREIKTGYYQSKGQAIAVAYAQVRKSHPNCRRFIKKH